MLRCIRGGGRGGRGMRPKPRSTVQRIHYHCRRGNTACPPGDAPMIVPSRSRTRRTLQSAPLACGGCGKRLTCHPCHLD